MTSERGVSRPEPGEPGEPIPPYSPKPPLQLDASDLEGLTVVESNWQEAVMAAVAPAVATVAVTADDLLLGPASGGTVTAVALASAPAYSNEQLVQFILDNPGTQPEAIASAFGRTRGWFLSVLASDQFQLVLDPHRHLIADPLITATMEERFRALTLKSLSALHSKLDNPEVSDFIAVKAAEIGIKALGMGAAKSEEAPLTPSGNVDTLAERLVAALEKQRNNSRLVAVDGEVVGGQQ